MPTPAPRGIELIGRTIHGGENPTASVYYWLKGVGNEAAAELLLLSATPMLISIPSCPDPLKRAEWECVQEAPLLWKGSMEYAPDTISGGKNPGPSEMPLNLTVAVSGEQRHIRQCLEVLEKKVPAGKSVIPFFNAINPTQDGDILGTDVLLGRLAFGFDYYFPREYVTMAFVRTLTDFCCLPNSAPFRGFPNGSVRMLGANGGFREKFQDWEFHFEFEGGKNMQNVALGNGITISNIRAFDYLSVFYRYAEDDTSKLVFPQIRQAEVQRVSDYVDYNLLGIG